MLYFSNFLFKEEFGVESGVESKLSRIKYWPGVGSEIRSGVAGQDSGQDFVNYFFCFIPMKTCQSLLVSKDGSKF